MTPKQGNDQDATLVVGFATSARRAIRRRLLAWYDKNQRDLPWRRRPNDGYAQLLAEFMLQQTQVAIVVDYYERFLKRFPTLKKLAAADLDDVLALWSGLGYYRRARNLHATARAIVEQHKGKVPATVDVLMTLPGIGRYTAGAIASIAYDTRAPVLDGNVTRVLARMQAIETDPKSPQVQSHLWELADVLLPAKRCGHFNQALMELGATICLPRTPLCAPCPLRSHCQAHKQNRTNQIPTPGPRTKALAVHWTVAAVQQGNRLLFVQRPPTGLWANLWELPSEPIKKGEPRQAAKRRLQKRLPVNCRLTKASAEGVTRQLSHRTITFHIYTAKRPTSHATSSTNNQPHLWATPADLRNIGMSRACQAVLKHLNWIR